MNLTITNQTGYWLINGNKYYECSYEEQLHFNIFLKTEKNK